MILRAAMIAGAILVTAPAFAGDYVSGYTRSNGTYVQPYHRSSPDSSRLNNYSSQGNVNPYTGRAGTVNPYAVYTPPTAPSYNAYGSRRY